ncbi:Glucosyl transferase GtrII [Lachnospiraceae bacterium XBB2008]|nr:Glucosyl transferase GtrII [Lachnospiraceae bacterium XBB2008]
MKKYSGLKNVFIITFIIGFISYGYVLTNYSPTHDGYMMVKTNQIWELSIGRFCVLWYGRLRGLIEAPWLLGILSLIYIGLAVYMAMELLEIPFDIWRTVIVSSVFLLNIAFISNAGVYIYCWDVYALALLFSVASAYLMLNVGGKMKQWYSRATVYAAAVLLLALSMGMYQAYFPVAAGLCVIYFCKEVIDKKDLKKIYARAAISVGWLVISGIVYYLILKICQRIYNTQPYSGAYESLDNIEKLSPAGIIKSVPTCYKQVLKYFFKDNLYDSRVLPYLNIALIVLGALVWISVIVRHVEGIHRRILIVALLMIFPLAINSVSLLTRGTLLQLMTWSYQLFYIAALYPILYRHQEVQIPGTSGNVRVFIPVLVLIILISCGVIRYANDLFYYQKLVGDGTQTQMNGIIYDMERTEGFDASVNPVILVGDIPTALSGEYDFKEVFVQTCGVGYGTTVTYNSNFEWYARYVMGKNYNFHPEPEVIQQVAADTNIESQPCYPDNGYCTMVDDCLIVRFN